MPPYRLIQSNCIQKQIYMLAYELFSPPVSYICVWQAGFGDDCSSVCISYSTPFSPFSLFTFSEKGCKIVSRCIYDLIIVFNQLMMRIWGRQRRQKHEVWAQWPIVSCSWLFTFNSRNGRFIQFHGLKICILSGGPLH